MDNNDFYFGILIFLKNNFELISVDCLSPAIEIVVIYTYSEFYKVDLNKLSYITTKYQFYF